ncbi:isoprenylcysteine carboxyl methyltransferase family protein [Gottfriedia acidiceleris]|uniref:isoprenylcysteine carboxyl methyltransferase family protein n=1 Tax=Gottfriedia acidiceleris TaxID=371036 RepID=UPI001F33DE42|nr:isoprenylcysteine carboxylmethyltransferase family protein [Gottfriedia acidiceleris]
MLKIIFLFIIIQRVIELGIAKNNEKKLKMRGALEFGQEHYKFFIILHSMFFISILIENYFIQYIENGFFTFLLIVFIILQLARVWVISTLGERWNTKIIILPNERLVKRGFYKYIKHPNYIIVTIELLVIPIMFHAYITTVIFSVCNLILLKVRIREENKALLQSIE